MIIRTLLTNGLKGQQHVGAGSVPARTPDRGQWGQIPVTRTFDNDKFC